MALNRESAYIFSTPNNLCLQCPNCRDTLQVWDLSWVHEAIFSEKLHWACWQSHQHMSSLELPQFVDTNLCRLPSDCYESPFNTVLCGKYFNFSIDMERPAYLLFSWNGFDIFMKRVLNQCFIYAVIMQLNLEQTPVVAPSPQYKDTFSIFEIQTWLPDFILGINPFGIFSASPVCNLLPWE